MLSQFLVSKKMAIFLFLKFIAY